MRQSARLLGLLLAPVLIGDGSLVMGSSVTLGWDASTDPTVTGYNVYSGTASRAYTNILNAGNSTSATISNLVPGVTYYFAATTYSLSGLESAYSAETAYTVPTQTTSNPPPTLSPISNVSINENSGPQTVNLNGISGGAGNITQTLTVAAFSSNPALVPNPAVNYTSPNTTGSLTLAPVANSYGTATITVMVDNGGASNNTVIGSFVVTVVPVNVPPTINAIANVTLNENAGSQIVNLSGITSGAANENQTLTVTASSSNPALIPTPTVSYSSPNSTGTLTLNLATNAAGSANITVTVDDGQPTNSSVSVSFLVTVNPSTSGPALLTNAIIAPNTAFRFLIPAPYNNGDKFSYGLAAGAPAGVKVSNVRGVPYLTWKPTTAQALTTNLIGIVINDQTNPSLSTNQSVLITVLDFLGLNPGLASVTAGQSTLLPIYLSSSSGVTNLSFTLAWPGGMFANPTLLVAVSGIGSSSLVNQQTNLLISLQTAAGQVLQKSNLIAQVSFQTIPSAPSGFVAVPASDVYASKPDGSAYVYYMPSAGQVAVVNTKPLLAPSTTTATTRTLTAFGNVGTTYQLQSSTNTLGSTWYPVMTYLQTNTAQVLSVDPSNPLVIYRLLVQ